MRSFVVMAMMVASLAGARTVGYTEERTLELAADGITQMEIDAGAGSMQIQGVEGSDTIRVKALIQVDQDNADKARKLIAANMRLALVREGDEAKLDSHFDRSLFGRNQSAIALEIEVPVGMALEIEDSAGSIVVRNTGADLKIDDSSGSIRVFGAGSVDIEDSSGSIHIADASGDVDVEDGSGSLVVERVSGSVRIDDGSGSIRVSDVEADVTIDNAGSGGVSVTEVRGKVTRND